MKTKLFLIIILASMASCGKPSYSPLDNAIRSIIAGDSLTKEAKYEAQKFIDSTNNAAILIHLHKY